MLSLLQYIVLVNFDKRMFLWISNTSCFISVSLMPLLDNSEQFICANSNTICKSTSHVLLCISEQLISEWLMSFVWYFVLQCCFVIKEIKLLVYCSNKWKQYDFIWLHKYIILLLLTDNSTAGREQSDYVGLIIHCVLTTKYMYGASADPSVSHYGDNRACMLDHDADSQKQPPKVTSW